MMEEKKYIGIYKNYAYAKFNPIISIIFIFYKESIIYFKPLSSIKFELRIYIMIFIICMFLYIYFNTSISRKDK